MAAGVIASNATVPDPGPQPETPIEEMPTLGRARVRPKVIEGEVKRRKFCPETGKFIAELLFWRDDEGEPHHRWFAEGELESVEVTETAPDPA